MNSIKHEHSYKILYISISMSCWARSRNTVNTEIFEGFIFMKLRICKVLWKIKPWPNSEIILLLTDEGKSWPSREFLTSQICLLMLFTESKILAKNFRIYSIHPLLSLTQTIYSSKHMFWVLKRTISMRWFFWVPTTKILVEKYNDNNFQLPTITSCAEYFMSRLYKK